MIKECMDCTYPSMYKQAFKEDFPDGSCTYYGTRFCEESMQKEDHAFYADNQAAENASGEFSGGAEKSTHDMVNAPPHYTQGSIECIDAMQSAFGDTELEAYCKIEAFKYIWRCEKKNGNEDIRKAIWYLQKYLKLKEKKEVEKVDPD